jgi:hypothetical protein
MMMMAMMMMMMMMIMMVMGCQIQTRPIKLPRLLHQQLIECSMLLLELYRLIQFDSESNSKAIQIRGTVTAPCLIYYE